MEVRGPGFAERRWVEEVVAAEVVRDADLGHAPVAAGCGGDVSSA
jgi:hypothetical protein